MILLTVGTDSPFDRMVKVVDEWANRTGRTDIFAQIGEGAWEPKSIPFATMIGPAEFKQRFASADVILGHAGMGTILSALHFGKPILVMPKKASLGEQRNEHQLATARRMQALGKVHVAFDEEELREQLDKIDLLVSKDSISPFASEGLISGLRDFIQSGVS